MENKNEVFFYDENEIDILENHIGEFFGEFSNVFHEMISPDIHVDIAIIPPDEKRDFYTLVTMGMGAYIMNVPDGLKGYRLERAELMVTLPSDWEVQNTDEKWYWPVRWLKILARFPLEENTWLGWGHTIPNGEPFAENTGLSGILLLNPYSENEKAGSLSLPNGDIVNFYQMFPLYNEEMEFKRENNAEVLLDLFGDDFDHVVDINRENIKEWKPIKDFYLKKEEIKDILQWEGAAGCFATDRITVSGEKVGYMYREIPDFDGDSVWRFTAGDETDEYMENPDNSGIYHLNTIANYDTDIIPFLMSGINTAFMRDENGEFQEVENWEPEE
ncbi:DUF2185 domain-containing protein [Sebaldella sp. S0638]|uniref:immunity protein Imm33 domain-containing protein n=1 Tax=Sebaldella sp. S0638 TaxID=2957809 RepID=UPI00209E80F4|nr:DUF2185 domain-containing protein [Sebaldella sp. S0638]MCP1224867.1 DUF2185 domain-containing protein [Sebaldella sp. S0638]